jgi:aminocarboxymuconate-semialdehyde decarboxylase
MSAPMQTSSMFDFHAHYVAPELIEGLARDGGSRGLVVRDEADGRRRAVLAGKPAGLPFLPTLSDLPGRLAWAARAGVDRQLVAGWMDLAGYHLEPSAGRWLTRLQNETLSAFVKANSDRFVGAAMVPMQDPAAAADELRHAVGQLGLRAVQIGTNINDRGLDEPELDPFWTAAEEVGVPIIVHPAELGGPDRLRRYFLHILVGNPSETTLAAGALLLGGVVERFPRLRFLMVHGGGFLPYQLGRMVRGFSAAPPHFRAKATKPPDAFLSSLFFDTIVHDPRALRYLLEVVGASQVVIGTDYPFPLQDAAPRASLEAVPDLAPADREAILSGNAERLIGRGR